MCLFHSCYCIPPHPARTGSGTGTCGDPCTFRGGSSRRAFHAFPVDGPFCPGRSFSLPECASSFHFP
ncbi:hypothetical protein HMPREF3038_02516 [Akkermansia sp. KLE1797]|nr:hypothetical protein HMPREF3038_02516 [Akkermansia sp. KLE1797]KXU52948.1 hypothetical protein HMPREF3039_02876 [Akkermansia sp. KLE1798]KZA03042.1 hypothetical protein HMPREF1326_03312 [Akkermansia sp. KLE1605]